MKKITSSSWHSQKRKALFNGVIKTIIIVFMELLLFTTLYIYLPILPFLYAFLSVVIVLSFSAFLFIHHIRYYLIIKGVIKDNKMLVTEIEIIKNKLHLTLRYGFPFYTKTLNVVHEIREFNFSYYMHIDAFLPEKNGERLVISYKSEDYIVSDNHFSKKQLNQIRALLF